jgi:gamma-glutamyltranspeptidase/glutathione hydrolase
VYADRTAYLADPKFEEVPLEGLLSKGFARTRFDDINPGMATPSRYRDTKPGNPIPFNHSESILDKRSTDFSRPGDESVSVAGPALLAFSEPAMIDAAGGHTTHLSVVDAKRNAVSLTQTLGTFFGSGLTAAGVLLNNARSNFSQTAKRNSVKGGKQPRSSISPTIVLKDGNVRIVLGSPGAARIVATVTQLLVNVIDYGMDAEQANDAPRFFCQKFDDHLYVESRIGEAVRTQLEAMGHSIQVNGDYDLFFGGAQIILVDPATGVCQGSADPRRGGASMGY